MRFGLFNLLQKRDTAKLDREIFEEMIEQTRLAESMGFETSWFGEHHFSTYSICPSPLVAAAYCAAHTERIKVGTGVLVLPLYDPVRVVQEIAMVDAMSNGRWWSASARATNLTNLSAFGSRSTRRTRCSPSVSTSSSWA